MRPLRKLNQREAYLLRAIMHGLIERIDGRKHSEYMLGDEDVNKELGVLDDGRVTETDWVWELEHGQPVLTPLGIASLNAYDGVES
jgi:hypothetical protein